MVGIEKFDISQRQPAGAATPNKLRADATLPNARPMGSQNFPKSLGVLVQPEMERGRSPRMSIPPLGRRFSRLKVYRSDLVSLRSAEAKPPRSDHRLDEPTGLSLSVVACPQCRNRFARQSNAARPPPERPTSWVRRIPGAIPTEHKCDTATSRSSGRLWARIMMPATAG